MNCIETGKCCWDIDLAKEEIEQNIKKCLEGIKNTESAYEKAALRIMIKNYKKDLKRLAKTK